MMTNRKLAVLALGQIDLAAQRIVELCTQVEARHFVARGPTHLTPQRLNCACNSSICVSAATGLHGLVLGTVLPDCEQIAPARS